MLVATPMLDSTPLSPGQFHVLSGGGRMRYAVLEPQGAPQATLLVAPGRREFIEKKHSELREFLDRNFRLIIFEWRGQGLSDRFLSGAARQRDHITDFAIHIDDFSSFFDAIVQPRVTGQLFATAHSMGGHLLLRWLAERGKTDIRAVILTAPMLALGPRMAHSLALGIGHAVVDLGFSEHYGPGQHNYGARDRNFIDNPLTNDPARFAIIERYFDAYPDMRIGGVTYGWLTAALGSMRDMRAPNYLERVTLPVLTLIGGKDHVTPAAETMRYLSHLPRGENIVINGALHDVMNETESLRAEAWGHIDRFLAKA